MSKIGRYSAARLKTEDVSDNKTVEIGDCGTVFFVSAGDKTITMPDAVDAGEGWWCRIVKDQGSGAGSEVTVNVSTNMADDAASNSGVGGGAAGSDGMEVLVGNFGFADDASKGTMAELYSDGVQWWSLAFSDAGSGITV